jgi:predicted metal-dependent peptidase
MTEISGQNEREKAVSRALRYAISKSPGFAAIALWCPYRVTGGDFVARTNGRSIEFGDGYFGYAPLEQAAILVHEILHVALRHIPRAKKANYDRLLWNYATDAVINEAIAQMGWLSLPADGVRMASLLTEGDLKQTPAAHWSADRIYHRLWPEFEKRRKIIKGYLADLEPGSDSEDPLTEEIWRERLLRAQAGDRPGGLLRAVSLDIPDSRVPWERVLRRLMTQPLLRKTAPNWNRPSRRTLASEEPFFEPGVRPQEGLNLAGVAVDTSGSIDDALLHRFAAEVQGIQQRTGCAVYLIAADAAIQSEMLIRNDGKTLKQKIEEGRVAFPGGGGTNFYPALQRFKEEKVRVAVYLTDMMGAFGDDRSYPFPVIWASTTPSAEAPFGRIISLE